jgi:hypothetical protein
MHTFVGTFIEYNYLQKTFFFNILQKSYQEKLTKSFIIGILKEAFLRSHLTAKISMKKCPGGFFAKTQ